MRIKIIPAGCAPAGIIITNCSNPYSFLQTSNNDTNATVVATFVINFFVGARTRLVLLATTTSLTQQDIVELLIWGADSQLISVCARLFPPTMNSGWPPRQMTLVQLFVVGETASQEAINE